MVLNNGGVGGGGDVLSSIVGAPDGQQLWLLNNLGWDVFMGTGNIGAGGVLSHAMAWILFYDQPGDFWHVKK